MAILMLQKADLRKRIFKKKEGYCIAVLNMSLLNSIASKYRRQNEELQAEREKFHNFNWKFQPSYELRELVDKKSVRQTA